jgi:hypothetical protein
VISEASSRDSPSSFSVRKTLFCAIVTKYYRYCKIERDIIVCCDDVSNKSIEEIYNPLITVALPSKHATILRVLSKIFEAILLLLLMILS